MLVALMAVQNIDKQLMKDFVSTTGAILWRDIPSRIKESVTRKLFAKTYWNFLIKNNNE